MRKWTEGEIEKFDDLVRKGIGWTAIASILGRTPESIRGRARGIGKKKEEVVAPSIDYETLLRLHELERKEQIYNEAVELMDQRGHVELHHISPVKIPGNRMTMPIVQISDNHIDEVVTLDSTMGMNEYNPEIAFERNNNLYAGIVKLINHHKEHYNIREMMLAYLGDSIGGWIHDELAQTNSSSPGSAIYKFKSMTISGLKYIHDNLDVDKIHVVMICGNHARTTKRLQFSNFTDTNYEYFMYLEIRDICKMMGLDKFEFVIPKAQMAVIEMYGKKMLFAHGNQFKFNGGVGGIFPSMFRWFGSMAKTLKVDVAFIGHWHTSIFTKRVIVNGSMKGYDAFAMGFGFEYEEPSQNMILLDSSLGFCNFQQIFV